LTERIIADLHAQGMQLDSREQELLTRASGAADRIEILERLVAKAGLTYTDKDGTVRPSPMLSEIRSTTLVLARCLGGIQMTPGKTPNAAKQRAGVASWAARVGRQDINDAAHTVGMT
jgi:hypothetical protein